MLQEIFKRRVKLTGRTIKDLEAENKELKRSIREFRIQLHWRGVAAYRPVEILKAYDKHFKL